MSSCEWVVATPPRQCGPQVQAPWHHGGHGAADVVRPVVHPVVRVAVGTQECTQISQNGLSELFWGICVHCCGVEDRCGDAGVYTDRRKRHLGAVLGHLCTLLRRELRRVARAPQLPWCAGSAPSVLCLSPSRENRFCASGAAARLAFSLRCQPTQTPEEPVLPTDFALFY